jgi:two-component system sensor histidine kinase/response regulator
LLLPLPEIPGLDVVGGLRRVLGKTTLYRELLQKFIASQSDVPAGVRTATAAGDWALAERIAHTLKGVSGNIGANDVSACAAALQAICREKAMKRLPKGLAALEATLTPLMTALQGFFAATETGAENAKESTKENARTNAGVSVDPARVKSVVKRLAGLLAENDAEAAEVLQHETDALKFALNADFAALEQAIQAFDFDRAQDLLGRVRT